MTGARSIEGTGPAAGFRFALVVSKYNDFVTDRLQAGALAALTAAGVAPADVTVVRVPGAFEIPIGRAARGRDAAGFDAVVCLGCVDSRRDAAFRVHRVGGGAWADRRGGARPACRWRSAC